MKHLLFLTPGFAADEQDSRCIPPLQLFVRKLQQEKNIKVSIISLHYPFSCQKSSWHGVSTYSAFKKGRWNKAAIFWQAIRWFRKIHREHPVDGIHSFWLTDAALLGQWLSKWYGLPHFVTLMGQDARASNKYLRLFSLKKLNTICLSSFHDTILQQSTGHKAKAIIPWGLDADHFPKTILEREFSILGVGNLIALKDYSTFVRLVKKVKLVHPQIKALLIGDGPERQALEKQIKEAGLEDHIVLAGYLPRQEVLGYMARSKVLLHPSVYESFGYVFLEALASGMAVVSRPVGIAEKGERWFLGKAEGELERGILEALAISGEREAVVSYTVEDTVRGYLGVWGDFFGTI